MFKRADKNAEAKQQSEEPAPRRQSPQRSSSPTRSNRQATRSPSPNRGASSVGGASAGRTTNSNQRAPSPANARLPPVNRKTKVGVSAAPKRAYQDRVQEDEVGEGLQEMNQADTFVRTEAAPSEEATAHIHDAVKKNMLFYNLDPKARQELYGAMVQFKVEAGTNIVTQGEEGFYFWILEEGDCDVYIADEAAGHPGQRIRTLGTGSCFGELALLYRCVRTATVQARTDCTLWGLDRHTFDRILYETTIAKRKLHENFLKNVKICANLDDYHRHLLADNLETMNFKSGENLVTQGQVEEDPGFYMITSGTCNVSHITEQKTHEELRQLGPGDYFGELSLLDKAPRSATVQAKGEVSCVRLSAMTFTRLLGNLSAFEGAMSDYKHYRRPEKSSSISAAAQAFERMQQKAEEEHGRIMKTIHNSDCVKPSDFCFLKPLGRGAYGTVWLARHKAGEIFAIKVQAKGVIVQKRKHLHHLLSEKDVLSNIASQPFIMQSYGTFQDSRFLYLITEYSKGVLLYEQLQHLGRFTENVARFMVAELVLALEYLTLRRLAHRDIKLENVILSHDGHIKLIDFGFARPIEDRAYTLCGTPECMAPELIINKGHGVEVDYWALGVLIYEMLAGVPPFEDPNNDHLAIYQKIINHAFHLTTITYPAFFSPEVRNLIDNLLIEQSHRYGCMQGGCHDIKAHPWFKGLDWELLACRQLPPPFLPNKELYASMEAVLASRPIGALPHELIPSVANLRPLTAEEQKLFAGF